MKVAFPASKPLIQPASRSIRTQPLKPVTFGKPVQQSFRLYSFEEVAQRRFDTQRHAQMVEETIVWMNKALGHSKCQGPASAKEAQAAFAFFKGTGDAQKDAPELFNAIDTAVMQLFPKPPSLKDNPYMKRSLTVLFDGPVELGYFADLIKTELSTEQEKARKYPKAASYMAGNAFHPLNSLSDPLFEGLMHPIIVTRYQLGDHDPSVRTAAELLDNSQ